MAVIEHPVLAELQNLKATVTKMTAELKAKESAIKDMNEQVKIAEYDTAKALVRIQETTDKRKAEILAELVPLEEKRHLIALADQALVQRKKVMEEETARLRVERNTSLLELDQQIKAATVRLNMLETAIAACKEKVSKL